ncbi:choice-of-anchor Q domain-containing protein [Marinicella sp. W31]|uniref:choice-of-anchor Q domain-containing protein n=1 Tax=Marinicella sp. W31 TaxID=3023713 RepID=UPI003756E3F7
MAQTNLKQELFIYIAQMLCITTMSIQLAHAGNQQIVVDSISDQSEAGFTTFREAVNAANLLSGAEIVFDESLFSSPQTITLEQGEVSITSPAPMKIVGPGAHLLTIDAGHLSRVLNINDGNNQANRPINITGITFANGNSDGLGGCILSRERLRLRASVIKNCNSSRDGGGVITVGNANLIENSLFINNTASNNGGGLSHKGGNGNNRVISTTFSGNSASNKGGGLYILQTDDYVIVNSTFSNNMAGNGAGMHLRSSATLTNVTIFNNLGTGVYLLQNNIQNSIFAGNTGGDCEFQEIEFSNQNNLDTDGSCDVNAINHITVADPLLGPLANNGGLTLTHLPLMGSPVIDMGDDLLCAELDQRGELRPEDGNEDGFSICDIGAVELLSSEADLIFSDGFEGPVPLL